MYSFQLQRSIDYQCVVGVATGGFQKGRFAWLAFWSRKHHQLLYVYTLFRYIYALTINMLIQVMPQKPPQTCVSKQVG